jgi:hypothetical protein
MTKLHQGGCHCGHVRFEINGVPRPVLVCHCSDCMKTVGNSMAATAALNDEITITGASLKWYQSSDFVERGFCSDCGAQMFYRRHNTHTISIAAGMFDDASVLKSNGQIYRHAHPGFTPLPEGFPDIDDEYEADHFAMEPRS